jgi:hypothetical protein
MVPAKRVTDLPPAAEATGTPTCSKAQIGSDPRVSWRCEPTTRPRLEHRTANCGSLRFSHPTLRLGPREPNGRPMNAKSQSRGSS